MAETYLQLTQQIEELQQKAATLKEQEVAGVIERIKIAIEAYGLTVDQLFSVGRKAVTGKAVARKSPGRSGAGKSASKARFRDETGNSWSGRGPRPRWIKAALAAGKSIEQFAVGAGDASASAAENGASAKPAKAGKSAAVAKFKDEAGNSWSGRGPRPRWFKAALAAGKTADQLAV